MAKLQRLDNIVESYNALLEARKVDYNSLTGKRSPTTKRMGKGIEDLKKDIVDMNKKCFSLFKQLLPKTIQNDWEKTILNQYYNKAGRVQQGGMRVVLGKTRGLNKESLTTCIPAWLCLNMPSDLAKCVRCYLATHVKNPKGSLSSSSDLACPN